MDHMEVEQKAATEEPPTAASNVPCPLSEQEIQHGWNTLMNKCWLQCADCNRWRNVPEEVRDKVRVALSSFFLVRDIWIPCAVADRAHFTADTTQC